MSLSASLSVDELPRDRVRGTLESYLRGDLTGEQLKSELYVGHGIHAARQAIESHAADLRGIDPERYQRLRRILSDGGSGVGRFARA